MKKILIIRFSSIGDIVLTTPVIRCLKTHYPDAELHFLTKEKYLTLLEGNPYLDKIYTIRAEITECLTEMKKEAYDFIVDLHNNLRTKRLKISLKRPSASFPKLNFEKFLYTRFKINRMPEKHIVDRYFETVQSLGVINDEKGLDFFINASDHVNLEDYAISQPYVAVAIGAQYATKRLPKEKLDELLSKIEKPIVLLGGKEDTEIGKELEEKHAHVIHLCGKLSLPKSASVISQSEQVITHDTGLMHIASAFHKRILSIWGNTTPQLGMYPYLPKDNANSQRFEVKNLSCRPCSKIGYAACPKKHFDCMNQQDITVIAQTANEKSD